MEVGIKNEKIREEMKDLDVFKQTPDHLKSKGSIERLHGTPRDRLKNISSKEGAEVKRNN